MCNQRWKICRNKYGINSIRRSTNGHKKWRLRSISSNIYNEKENLSPDEMSYILNKQSGAYGISGVSVDFRDIEADAAAGGHHAQLALDNYHYLIACYIARCVVAMNGIDVLTFTAGVGEKGQDSRKAICDHLGFLELS